MSVEKAFVSHLTLHRRWLLWHLEAISHIQQDKVCDELLTAYFLQSDSAQKIFQDEEAWKEWGGEAPDCFQSVDKVLGIEFLKITIKKMAVGNPIEQTLKWDQM